MIQRELNRNDSSSHLHLAAHGAVTWTPFPRRMLSWRRTLKQSWFSYRFLGERGARGDQYGLMWPWSWFFWTSTIQIDLNCALVCRLCEGQEQCNFDEHNEIQRGTWVTFWLIRIFHFCMQLQTAGPGCKCWCLSHANNGIVSSSSQELETVFCDVGAEWAGLRSCYHLVFAFHWHERGHFDRSFLGLQPGQIWLWYRPHHTIGTRCLDIFDDCNPRASQQRQVEV